MEKKRSLFNVSQKLTISCCIAFLWLMFSIWLGMPWLMELSTIVGFIPAVVIISGLAYIPGFGNAFVVISALFDSRPIFKEPDKFPDITILIAAFNEESCIQDTLDSIAKQDYTGYINVLVGDDGSSDLTREKVEEKYNEYYDHMNIQIHSSEKNVGKGNILNKILAHAKTEYIITIDADTYLFKDALRKIVTNIMQGPPNTGAVAGSILVRNSRKNFMTRVQEWDYFQGIAITKRIQSLYQGTLVAAGAFSIYRTDVVKNIGGWDNTVGEDIVLTWAIRQKGYRVSYSEEAVSFTNAPETYIQFFHQRKRWARGLIEAFKKFPSVLWKLNKTTPFIWLNLTFPLSDCMFMFVFVPGIFAAIFFQYYAIVGIMTLVLLPMIILMNYVIWRQHIVTFEKLNLKVRKNIGGFIAYIFLYQIMMVPAIILGYLSEFFNFKKTWGTK